jgi:hypothetical protein
MSVVSTASAAVAANHALNAQAMKMAALKMKNEAAASIVQVLEQAITPAAGTDGAKATGSDKTKVVDVKV